MLFILPQLGHTELTAGTTDPIHDSRRLADSGSHTASDVKEAKASVRTAKAMYAPREAIEVIFSGLPGQPKDWIALAERGAPDRRTRGGRKYTNAATSGRVTLRGRRVGEYEVRAYAAGGYEVIARAAFQIDDGSSVESATAVRGANHAATPPAAPEAANTSTSQSVEAELQRLIGTWIGRTRCGDQASNLGMQSQDLVLTVRIDGTKAKGVAAEVRGISWTAGIALDVTYHRKRGQYEFNYTGWLPTGSGKRVKPYGLSLAFVNDSELLYGDITGRTDCTTVVVGKLPHNEAPPNTDGLLYKMAARRILVPLTENKCAEYARWLASGEVSKTYGINSALTDSRTMRRVLGHDLGQWTDEDAQKIAVIPRACKKLLNASTDPELVELGNLDQVDRAASPPLRSRKSTHPNNWNRAYFVLYRPLLAEVLKTREAIEEGLLARTTPDPSTSAPPDDTGLAGEWRGYYGCQGGKQVFMRLTFTATDNPMDVRLEFGPSLDSMHPYGLLSMAGTFDARASQITLQPRDWLHQPRGQVHPLGFAGHFSEDGRVIEGKVDGNPDCTTFSVTKRRMAAKPVNPGGLLFHYLERGMITASVADCRQYAEWLAAGDHIYLGKIQIFSGLRNAAAMRKELGKDLSQWGQDDHKKMLTLGRHCRNLLQSQVDSKISDLLAPIETKKLVWAPRPLTVPRDNSKTPHWLATEQAIMMNEQQRALAARKLAAAESLPAVIDSLDYIDVLAKETDQRLRGPLGYLSKQELGAYLDGLSAARVVAAVAAASAAARTWSGLAQKYPVLEKVELEYKNLRKKFKARQALAGVDALDAAYKQESDGRADTLWPDEIRLMRGDLRSLANADLLRFREFSDNRDRQFYLARFHNPGKGDRYFDNYQSMRALHQETVQRMVERSAPQLLAWITALPPSAGANKLLDQFAVEVFDVEMIPEQYAKLRRAATAKKRSYNPDGYSRPDIIMSVMRGQWNEVNSNGLEDLAYITTSLRKIKEACPSLVPEGGPLMSYVLDLSQRSTQRIVQGKVRNRREAERAMFLFFNNIINQPGCRVIQFGTVTSCTSHEDQTAAQEFIMTSGAASSDMRKLLGSGCNGASNYVNGLVAYSSGGRGLPLAPAIRDFWSWTAQQR